MMIKLTSLFIYVENKAFAIAVSEAVQVPVDVDEAHVLGPSRVWISIVIQIQDGGPKQFDE